MRYRVVTYHRYGADPVYEVVPVKRVELPLKPGEIDLTEYAAPKKQP
ncbi:MAG TPA: hypothetical protein VGE74_03515 [Gemmata sp.]